MRGRTVRALALTLYRKKDAAHNTCLGSARVCRKGDLFMVRRFLLCVLSVAVVLVSNGMAAGASNWRDDVHRFRYDPSAEQVYEGMVGSESHLLAGLMYFTLRMSERSVQVQIGSPDFVERSGFQLKIGEMITVVGMPLAWNGRNVVLARRVSNATSVLIVRDRDGHPMWVMKTPVQMDPEVSELHLCEMFEP